MLNLSHREQAVFLVILLLVFVLPLAAVLVRREQQRQIEGAPPQGASVLINSGAQFTNQRQVTLQITPPRGVTLPITTPANQRPPAQTMMQVSNDPRFADAQSEPSAASKSWMLNEGDGEKTVYVRFSYLRGRTWTQPISDTIVLDTTAPDTRIVGGPEEGEVVNTDQVQFEFEAKE